MDQSSDEDVEWFINEDGGENVDTWIDENNNIIGSANINVTDSANINVINSANINVTDSANINVTDSANINVTDSANINVIGSDNINVIGSENISNSRGNYSNISDDSPQWLNVDDMMDYINNLELPPTPPLLEWINFESEEEEEEEQMVEAKVGEQFDFVMDNISLLSDEQLHSLADAVDSAGVESRQDAAATQTDLKDSQGRTASTQPSTLYK